MNQPSYKQPNILGVLQQHGMKIFTRPHELNIIGVRSSSTISNKFDDIMYLCYNTGNNNWVQHRFKMTTDPGLHFINKPMNSAGTAILKDGQYLNTYQLGLHRGKYKALVQRKPLTVYRSKGNSRNIDAANKNKHTGMFGINIHHASGNGTSADVDRWSAGCQVIANINNFKTMLQLAEQHAKLYGNHFTYTLLDYRIQGYQPEPLEENTTAPIVAKPSTENDTYHASDSAPNNDDTKEPTHKKIVPLVLLGLLGAVCIGTTIYYFSSPKANTNNTNTNNKNQIKK
jgi:hypothetical protein